MANTNSATDIYPLTEVCNFVGKQQWPSLIIVVQMKIAALQDTVIKSSDVNLINRKMDIARSSSRHNVVCQIRLDIPCPLRRNSVEDDSY